MFLGTALSHGVIRAQQLFEQITSAVTGRFMEGLKERQAVFPIFGPHRPSLGLVTFMALPVTGSVS
jgi:hypothetical protein